MAQIRLGIGQVNIVDYLKVIARKTTTPLVIEAQETYAPPQPAIRNVVVPAVGDIDPVIYYIDVRESSDGTSLGLLLSQYTYDLKNKIILAEKRFYLVGGPGANDPAPNQPDLVDAYLDGKYIAGVYKEGFRPLVPPAYAYKEYDYISGGGITLLNDKVWGEPGEVIVVEISYAADQTQVAGGGGMYNGVATITEDTNLAESHRGKRLKCESAASSRLVVTLEDVNTVPDGTFYHFTSNGGNQFQTRINAFTGQAVAYHDTVYSEFTIAKGEYLRIEKFAGAWEATMVHSGLLQVGERFSGTWKDHPNTKPEDGALYDGDDWPRPWWWIKNRLPATHYIIDDNVVNNGYTHPTGKEGLFVIHSTLKKFRLPNTQYWSERGLGNFTTYNTDSANRPYDYPGGTQAEMVGSHTHDLIVPPGKTSTTATGSGRFVGGSDNNEPVPMNTVTTAVNTGTENRVKNIGVIYLRRF